MADNVNPWVEPKVSSLEQGILFALSYADIYDYPLTQLQIHRYLVGIKASLHEVIEVLDHSSWAERHLANQGQYYMLPGRESLALLRQQRTSIAEEMWIRARYFAQAIARIPFVRMVALTGALAMNNVEIGDDYDYYIVTASDHLWFARFLIVQLVVKPALRRGEEVCPNYIVTEKNIVLNEEDRDLYHAHELAQMVPIYGLSMYQRMRLNNAWAHHFLPNAVNPPEVARTIGVKGNLQRNLTERFFHFAAGGWFERTEMSRMSKKLNADKAGNEVVITLDQCKGHIGENSMRTRAAFEARINRLGVI